MKKLITSVVLLFFTASFAQTAEQFFKPLKYRLVGPFRGGRSVTATGVVGDNLTYYMGITGGGLWKTTDAGQHWNNISDGFFKTGSVGAVAVSTSDTNVVYCGMGEHAPRGVMTSSGDGVYKSTDAGKTWKHIGLTKTRHISRIIIHPKNPDIVYVAAQGALYGPSQERGIYKSINGGETWEKVLFVNTNTGASELSMDLSNPNVLYAGTWHHQRRPWEIESGGEGSGIYKTTDAGKTWKKIEKGLPKELGKTAISVSQSNPNKVYALVESDSNKDLGGLFVSNNGGENWRMVSGDNRLTQRSWYYTEVFADPNNENTVYVLSAPALRSIDGGKTWSRLGGTHGDFHDLWINPNNSNNMIIANDGGAAISFNFGKTWSAQDAMPTSQFYRVHADNLFPYNIYGGQQDNSSVKIASIALGSYGIDKNNWSNSAGGESAFLAFDPENPRYVLGGSYLGTIEVLDTKQRESTNIMAAPLQYLGLEARQMKYLYNWNAPIIKSQHLPNTFYHAAQLVLQTDDMGKTWKEISPDLTRNIDAKQGNGGRPYTNEAVGAENYGTISYLIESPHEKGVLWSGSDDGYVHITRDGGKTWTNVTPKGLGESLVNAIDVSPHDPATAYIATTKYKFNDHTPAMYMTTNYGKTWTSINNGIPNDAFTRVVREDTKRKGLLYAGTEKGMYISWNNGKNWESFQLNLPVTPILDLKVHMGDLLIATSGRAFWVLDDLGLLSEYKKPSDKVELYKPEDAMYARWGSPLNGNSASFKGAQAKTGTNPANGVVVYYYLPKTDKKDVFTLKVKDANSTLVNEYTTKSDKSYKRYDGGPSPVARISKKEGLNRFVWNMRYPTLPGIENVYIESSYAGHRVAPGTYTLELTKNGTTVATTTAVIKFPKGHTVIPKTQLNEFHTFMTDAEAKVKEMHDMVNTLNDASKQLKKAIANLKNDALVTKGNALLEKIKAWDNDMVQRKSKAYDDVENFPNKFSANYMFMMNQTESSIPRVNQSSMDVKAELDKQWATLKAKGSQLLNTEIPNFNKELWSAGVGAIQIKK